MQEENAANEREIKILKSVLLQNIGALQLHHERIRVHNTSDEASIVSNAFLSALKTLKAASHTLDILEARKAKMPAEPPPVTAVKIVRLQRKFAREPRT